jgi:hypothetical protein
MNAIVLFMILFHTTGWAQTATSVQSRFYAKNIKRIDSFNRFLKTYCDSRDTGNASEDKSVKKDKDNIRYVSKLYNANQCLIQEFVQMLKHMSLIKTAPGGQAWSV